jgi:hypothetical protein
MYPYMSKGLVHPWTASCTLLGEIFSSGGQLLGLIPSVAVLGTEKIIGFNRLLRLIWRSK